MTLHWPSGVLKFFYDAADLIRERSNISAVAIRHDVWRRLINAAENGDRGLSGMVRPDWMMS